MPGSLGQLVHNRRRIDIPLDDGNSIYIVYRPMALTPRLMEDFEAAQNERMTRRRQITLMSGYLLAVIEEWDALDKAGKVIPLTKEGFAENVDYEQQLALFQLITEDSHMGEANGANSSTPSDSTSSPMATRATSRRRRRHGSR